MIRKIIRKCRLVYQRFYLLIWVNWFNPFYTLFFNLIFFPFRQAIFFPVWIYGWPRLYSHFGNMECIGKCYSGMVRINMTIHGAPQAALASTELNIWGKVIFRGKCVIGTSNRIGVAEGGVIDFGDGTKIMTMCNVNAVTRIEVGAQSRIVHRCQLLDTNFHYMANFNNNTITKIGQPIIIGDYCWVCNSTTITGGAIIPNKTIVASNSLVNKDMNDIPEESIIGGVPAKYVKSGIRRVDSEKWNQAISRFFYEHPDCHKLTFVSNSHAICDVDVEGYIGSSKYEETNQITLH